jgi:hypothetical protein
VRHAIAGALLLGAVSTLGDFVWAAFRLQHRMGYGLAHGAVVCLCVGLVIGWRARRAALGAAAGPFVGVAAAGLFYMLAPALGYSAMFPAWMFFWICFGLLQAQLDPRKRYAAAVWRGVAAAVLSGLAFYAISGIWTRPSPGGPDYVRHLWSWTMAFLPGFAALFAGVPAHPQSHASAPRGAV